MIVSVLSFLSFPPVLGESGLSCNENRICSGDQERRSLVPIHSEQDASWGKSVAKPAMLLALLGKAVAKLLQETPEH